jgi:hypothetical protein
MSNISSPRHDLTQSFHVQVVVRVRPQTLDMELQPGNVITTTAWQAHQAPAAAVASLCKAGRLLCFDGTVHQQLRLWWPEHAA